MRHIGILLPVLIWTTYRNFHVILHHATKFCPNRSTHCRNMTSFPFFKMASTTAKYQFLFCTRWCHCLQKVEVCQQTKFRRHISIDGWDVITSVFLKQTSAILEIYFWFRFQPFVQNPHISLQQGTEFRSKSKHPLRKYDVIFISQDGGCDR